MQPLGHGGRTPHSPEGRLENGQGDVVLALVPGGTGEEAGLDAPEAVLPYQCLNRFGREAQRWGWGWGLGRHVGK